MMAFLKSALACGLVITSANAPIQTERMIIAALDKVLLKNEVLFSFLLLTFVAVSDNLIK